jgi:hypothetical protein
MKKFENNSGSATPIQDLFAAIPPAAVAMASEIKTAAGKTARGVVKKAKAAVKKARKVAKNAKKKK